MDLRDLELLLEVVRVGSVQRAASVLRLSRSTVRRQLANLEEELGVPLLVRGDQGVGLTPAGMVVVAEGRILLANSQQMAARARTSLLDAGGTARVILPTGVRRELRLILLKRLRSTNPGLRIDERECEDPLAHVHEPFDLMFYMGGPPPLGTWYSRVLARVAFRLFASPRYLERAGAPKDVAELADHPIASWHSRDVSPEELPLVAGGATPIKPWFTSRNLENVMATVREGLALALGPVFMDNEGLQPVLVDVIGTRRTVRVLSPRATSDDPRWAPFLRGIDELFATWSD